jgi:phosphatidylglycerophosphatase C
MVSHATRASQEPTALAKPVAVFDFDKTIVNKDTGAHFIRYYLARDKWRLVLAGLVAPLVAGLFLSCKTRYLAISAFLWLATCGLSKRQIALRYRDFWQCFTNHRGGCSYPAALAALAKHRQAGHDILIISGTPATLVRQIMRQIAPAEQIILGSKVSFCWGGLVVYQHCYRHFKLAVARAAGLNSRLWRYGYSDSYVDIPLLSQCEERFLVNPSKKTLAKSYRAFGKDIKVLHWPPPP